MALCWITPPDKAVWGRPSDVLPGWRYVIINTTEMDPRGLAESRPLVFQNLASRGAINVRADNFPDTHLKFSWQSPTRVEVGSSSVTIEVAGAGGELRELSLKRPYRAFMMRERVEIDCCLAWRYHYGPSPGRFVLRGNRRSYCPSKT